MRKKVSLAVIILIIFVAISGETAAVTYGEGLTKRVVLTDGPKVYEYTLQELGLALNFAGDVLKCEDPGLLSYRLFCLSRQVEVVPSEARFSLNENKELQIEPEKWGRKLDLAGLITQLGNPGPYRETYPLPFLEVRPSVTAAELQKQYPQRLWAEYSTILVNIPDRTENVRLAAARLEGLLIEPGEEVSFNDTVGPRDAERGYRTAQIIVEGRFIDGLGGGVCQVSSTLYNVLLSAGLEIRERHPHSLTIAYVPKGRDATVVYGVKDLVFANNTETVLLLKTAVEGLRLTIGLYGADPGI